VAARSLWGLTPRQSVELECARRGTAEVVAGCAALLAGGTADERLVLALGGPAAHAVLDGAQQYWLRVWGARGLLYAWDGQAADTVTAALADEHWRVREMAAKVVRRHRLGEALPAVAALEHDPVPRVRAAAARALATLTANMA
jgi:HEAT repeat protein